MTWTLLDIFWLGCAVIWAAWALQSILGALLTRKLLSRWYGKVPAKERAYRPAVAVIVPIKGIDDGLEENLRRMLEQDYPDYRLVVVVETQEDPACQVVRAIREASGDRVPLQLLVAGEAPDDQGQKTHNQLCALQHLLAGEGHEQVWAFADIDAAPGPHWLAHLVGPLCKDYKGATTGYRYFVPQPGPDGRVGFWSHMASILNASACSWMAVEPFIHAWGGSMALRRETAIVGDLATAWQGALSDDYQLSAMIQKLGLEIDFVPQCLVASPVHYERGPFIEFVRRQYIVTRCHKPWMIRGALAMLSLYLLGWITALCWLAIGLVQAWRGAGAWGWLVPLLAITIAMIADMIRSHYRRKLIHTALDAPSAAALQRTLWYDRLATPLWMAINWLLAMSILGRRTITWRGKRYIIRGPREIARLRPNA